ncbi:uncharacterized protein LOC132893778 isoform X2 [Neoarius graeffei]|uniref:uncharacterized protein LOC132893778 isoform X2 n=1 Tax=Neoarius graeffei TaxID=443677 RepID=UPI00298CEE00|nr:uncharacterized protein LOC132893778 isoform X2 [Neoarius graeffei]
MGVPDRARQTLPLGLEIQKSSIPDAGLGVFNKGETVPVGAHFGSYQGELVDGEEDGNGGYSLVALHQLDHSRLISVSMDGPNVNWKLLDLLQQDHAQLVSVGSCGLHTLHNSFKAGFSMWNVDKILKAMHTLFHNVPARREDYEQVTKSTWFPKPFCGHRWLENLPVIEQALEVWPSLMLYMDAVHKKQLPNPKMSSFDTIEAAIKDPLMTAKMHFFMTVARTFHPFMKKYQTDEPMMPFLAKDLAELIKSLLRRCVKREVLQYITPLQLTKLDLSNKTLLLLPHKTDIGLGAETAVKGMPSSNNLNLSCVLRQGMKNLLPSNHLKDA